MPEKQTWMEKFTAEYIKASNFDPMTEKNKLTVQTFRSIAQMVGLRAQGLDHRKMALLAKDMSEYHLLNRKRAIDDVARIAVKETEKEVAAAKGQAS